MANGHGGARIGAGQKKKALSERIVEGNPGKRKLTVMEFTDTADLQGEKMPPPRDYLAARQKNGKELLAVEVYERIWTWLHERGCAHLMRAAQPLLLTRCKRATACGPLQKSVSETAPGTMRSRN